MVIGCSVNRAPLASAPSSNSDAWYCGWRNRTEHASSVRIPRKPNDVSVIFRQVNRLASVAYTRTPSQRTRSSLGATPSRREPVTKSCVPATSGPSSSGISVLSYWPSASVVIRKRAPPRAASW